MNLFWASGAVYTILMAWLLLTQIDPATAWKYYVALCAVPGILVFFARLAVPESPRYLMVTNRTEEANKVFHQISKFNGTTPLRGTLLFTANDHTTQKNVFRQVLQLLSPSLRRSTILLMVIWFLLSFGSWGFDFILPIEFQETSTNVTDNRVYVQAMIMVGVAIGGFATVSIIMDKFGRKRLMGISLMLAGICTALVSVTTERTYVLVIAMAAGFLQTFPWGVLTVYTPEVFPTVIRTTGVGTCSAFTRVAGGFSPLMFALYGVSRIPVYIIFGAALVLAGIVSLLLPIETLNRALQDGIDDRESFFQAAVAQKRPSQAQPLMSSGNFDLGDEDNLSNFDESSIIDDNQYVKMEVKSVPESFEKKDFYDDQL
jgi:putative MFS transporter